MSSMEIFVEGVGLWSPQLANFEGLRAWLNGQPTAPPAGRPAAAVLPPNERRRAPESVLLAVEVAGQAASMSGRSADSLACVFASSYGDQSITDYMCATLARAPLELSPTRFHNSVHNAAAGYWTIATGCHEPSTAIAAQRSSFGAGLLEAASQALADERSVLFTCSDTPSSGALGEVIVCSQPFGCALVLAPAATDHSLTRLRLSLNGTTSPMALPEPMASWRRDNASAAALPLLLMLAGEASSCQLDAARNMGLQIDMEALS